jgi:hypothetical protein
MLATSRRTCAIFNLHLLGGRKMASREATIDTIYRAYDARGKGDIEGLMALGSPRRWSSVALRISLEHLAAGRLFAAETSKSLPQARPRPDQIDDHPTNEPAKIPHRTAASPDSPLQGLRQGQPW